MGKGVCQNNKQCKKIKKVNSLRITKYDRNSIDNVLKCPEKQNFAITS